jgi:hypothetical protein
MTTILYKDGVEHRVDPLRVYAHIQNGYTTELTPVAAPVESESYAELEAARELYEEKFGKKPHHKKAFATLMAELEEAND